MAGPIRGNENVRDDFAIMEMLTKKLYRHERLFTDARDKFLSDLKENWREVFGNNGLAILVYHRSRLELEVNLLCPSKMEVFSLRDVVPDDYDELTTNADPSSNGILGSLAENLEFEPKSVHVYPVAAVEKVAAAFVLLAREEMSALQSEIERSIEERKLTLQLAIMQDELQRRKLELELLQETGAILSTSIKMEEVFQSIVAALERLLSFDAVGIFILIKGGEAIDELFSYGYENDRSNEMLQMKAGKGLVGHAVKTGEAVIVPDVREDARYVAAREETRAELVVPLFSGTDIMGAFNLESDSVDAFSPSDLEIVTAFANQASLSIVRARLFEEALDQSRLKQQLQVARDIQKSFQPRKFPENLGFDFDAINISSEEVGGDYFDFIPIVDRQIGVTIADVSGKGLPASLIMASFRASLIAEIRNNYAIRTILRKVNNLICESVERGKFVTAVYGVLDTKNRILTFSNAGHNPPFLLRTSGKVEFLKDGGWTLGIMKEKDYEERPIHIDSGDVLCFFTDGVTEAENDKDELFGTERLVELVKQNRARSSREIREKIVDAVSEFRDPDRQPDDLTLIVIKAL